MKSNKRSKKADRELVLIEPCKMQVDLALRQIERETASNEKELVLDALRNNSHVALEDALAADRERCDLLILHRIEAEKCLAYTMIDRSYVEALIHMSKAMISYQEALVFRSLEETDTSTGLSVKYLLEALIDLSIAEKMMLHCHSYVGFGGDADGVTDLMKHALTITADMVSWINVMTLHLEPVILANETPLEYMNRILGK